MPYRSTSDNEFTVHPYAHALAVACGLALLAPLSLAQLGPHLTEIQILRLHSSTIDHAMVVPDFSGDRVPELLYGYQGVLYSSSRSNTDPIPLGEGTATTVLWRDWDGDGFADLGVGLPEQTSSLGVVGVVRIYDGKEIQTTTTTKPKLLFERYGQASGALYGSSVAMLDLNGDAREDLLVSLRSSSEAIDGKSGALLYSIPVAGSWRSVGDVDGDGRQDFFSAPEVRSGKDGSVLRSFTHRSPTPLSWPVGDVTGDGVSEFVEYVRHDGQVSVFWLWSGRGYRKLGEWKVSAPWPIEFKPYDGKRFQIQIERWNSISFGDAKFREAPLVSKIDQRFGAFPWTDIDGDGSIEALIIEREPELGLIVNAYSLEPYSFYATYDHHSGSGGRDGRLVLQAPLRTHGNLTMILGTMSGTKPFFRLLGREIPILPDAYTMLILTSNTYLQPSVFWSSPYTIAELRYHDARGAHFVAIAFDKAWSKVDFVSNVVPYR